jgi:XTP/dITP diphosphohydrolase
LTLFLASSNPGKLREFQIGAAEAALSVQPVPGISRLPPCHENGDTFEANARKKALHYAEYADGVVFADDSGLVVDALNGAPGVHSARFSGPGATEDSNNQKLISQLYRRRARRRDSSLEPLTIGSLPLSGFPAHYVCVIAVAEGGKIQNVVEGRCDGMLIESPRGTGGFGYDPYFFYPPLGKAFAELAPEEKFRVSHRGIAFRRLLEFLGAR